MIWSIFGLMFSVMLLQNVNATEVAPVASQLQQSAQDQSDSQDIWGDDDWGDEQEEASPWLFSGFAEAGFGAFTQHNVTDKQQSLAELRGRGEVSYQGEGYVVTAKGDLLADGVMEQLEFDARELNLAFSPLQNTDVILGRQVITWGTGDYLFLNDLFAKDWQSFFAGRDDAYLKAPNDSVRVMQYVKNITFDLVYSPEFTPDNFITGERFSFYSPQAMTIVAPERFPLLENYGEQYAVRVATSIKGIEYALYGSKGYWTTPTGIYVEGDNAGLAYFPELHTYGASIRTPLASGLFNGEIAVYNSVEDSRGDNPFIANDQVRLLFGYEQELVKDLTGAVQFYLEHTDNYDEYVVNSLSPETQAEENRQVLTVRLTHLSKRQTLTSSLFVFYSPTDQDGYLKPSMTYRYNDNWTLAGGANVFWGEQDYSFFGQQQDNTNLWLRLRFNY
ncbi:hypothetical protein E8M12_12285 [Thalassotalea mangrovi]|uniref:Porin n=2 Tax=Thalassotalea mangrovi TaxID=2572245 RepID=A0A4U1B4P2_9GAMM|nr:hypothetical protein E8M12_12285 [Thalassotalea mangrovi]